MAGLRDALPWMGGGLVLTANQRAAEEVLRGLDTAGRRVVELEGERIVSRESFFAHLSEAVGLPLGPDWAAFRERRGRAERLLGEHAAVVWHRADHSAFFSLATVAEAVHELLAWREERRASGADLEVVLLGSTRDFPEPSP